MVKELIEKLNKYFTENDVYSLDEVNQELEEELKKVGLKCIAKLDRDEHRWYTLSENVYRVHINGKNYYIGVWEVETIKSEMMDLEDCGVQLEFFEMEKYTTISYRRKEN